MAKKKDFVEEEIIEEEIVEEEGTVDNEKEIWKLNAVESLAYDGMKTVFVGAFMIGDLLGCNSKKDSEE